MTVPIFKSEVDAGLSELVQNNKLVLSASIKSAPQVIYPAHDTEGFSVAKSSDSDLYALNTILVSTGWNKNSDIFDKAELWASYQTAEDKPLNIGHNHTKIVGHITSCMPINVEGKVLASSSPLDEIPDLFHILTSAVLYRTLKPEAAELKAEIEKIIAEISLGKWFVSMECLFKGFDYGIIDAGTHKVVQRNQETAFLTKHLRAYGGNGSYNGKQIGRVLRNITFSGKGLVENPANPYSIIIAENFKPSLTTAEIGDEMANEDKALEKVEALLKAEVDRRAEKAKAKEIKEKQNTEAKELRRKEKAEAKKQKLEASKAKIAELEAKVTELETSKAGVVKELEKTKAELAESVKMFSAVRVEKDQLEKDGKKVARTEKTRGKIEADKAVAFVEKFFDLDDEKFAALLDAIPAKAGTVDTTVTSKELEGKVEGAGTVASTSVEAAAAESKKTLSNDLSAFLAKVKKETK